MRLLRKKIIYGCEARGDGESPYLTRWQLNLGPLGALYLHIFHRSDADDLHDHPWAFFTLILWRGYIEETKGGGRRRLWPGTIHYRHPEHTHRVELLDGKPAVTLVWRGVYCREWGFHTRRGWVQWRRYFEELGC